MEGTGSPIAVLPLSLPVQEEEEEVLTAVNEEEGGGGETHQILNPLASFEDETSPSSLSSSSSFSSSSSSSDVDQPLRTDPPSPRDPQPDLIDSTRSTEPLSESPPAPPPPPGSSDCSSHQDTPAGSSTTGTHPELPEEGEPTQPPPPSTAQPGLASPALAPSLETQDPLLPGPPSLAPSLETQDPLLPGPPALAPPGAAEVLCGGPQDEQPCAPSCVAPGPKLCGYLEKRGGPLRAWKRRWFTYEEKKSRLFYYRTSQDINPLGRVELGSATFTFPLKGEDGCFHIQTPERTYILKAVNQEAMMYWLQQLQMRRWHYRELLSTGGSVSRAASSDPARSNNNNNLIGSSMDFLPMVKSPLGVVGEEAASQPPRPRTGLANMSIKHPLIEFQNSVHNLLAKRSSQEFSQSIFHVESAPPWTPPSQAAVPPGAPQTPITPMTPTPTLPSTPIPPSTPTQPSTPSTPALPLAGPEGEPALEDGRNSPGGFITQKSRRSKSRGSSAMSTLRRETSSAERMSRLQQEKDMLGKEVKSQKELVWLLHKALEASQLEKRTCAEFLAAEGEQQRLEVLRHRERQAVDLRTRLDQLKTQEEALRRSLAERDAQVADLQENIDMLTEKNRAKQEVILKLSDQLTTCMADPHRKLSTSNGLQAQTCSLLQEEKENLKDDIAAYKTQNRFLNSEIYQLTKLWRKSSEQEKSLMVKCASLEAHSCQKESRYLGVLQRLQENKTLDPAQQAVVRKLIEDALQGDRTTADKPAPLSCPPLDHDEYGFKILPDYEVEDIKLLAKIQALEIRSHNLLFQDTADRPLLGRWSQYLASRADGDLCPSVELKSLLRAGVPREYRQLVWRWMVRARTLSLREQHPDRYQKLCLKPTHPASRQILLDLHRTLTTNKHFSSPSSPTLQKLQRILLAFSWQNPNIGYCQGLNRLAALSLLVLQDEEDAFWCLVSVVEVIMPQDYYTKNLVASQADQRVLKDFMAEKLPRLSAHFEEHAIDVSLITFNWFLVVFVESLPSDILLRVWDAFLYEGPKVLFRYALAIFKYKEEDILKIHDSVEIYQYLRFFTKTVTDGRKLTSIAFSVMNPFPGRILRNRRAGHLERLQGELRELEEQQKEFLSESRAREDLDNLFSEDDEEGEAVSRSGAGNANPEAVIT